jgi:ABC-type sugar transport system ATPase subunit
MHGGEPRLQKICDRQIVDADDGHGAGAHNASGRQGRQVGTPLDLYNKPANRFVAGFIGSPRMNFIEALVDGNDGNAIVVDLGGRKAPLSLRAPLSPGDKLTLGIRPQDAILTDPQVGLLALDVTLVEQLGAETIVHARTEGGAPFTLATAGQKSLAVGDRVGVNLPTNSLHAFGVDGRALGQ